MKKLSLNEFIDENMSLSIHECNKCGHPVELTFEPYDIFIEDKRIQIDKLPQLKCIICNNKVLTEKAKKVIVYLFDELVKGNRTSVISNHNHMGKRYPFCQKYGFKYDYEDYENIPGLTALNGDGFLTPIYFHKYALIYFMHHPEYELNLFSETYGELRYKDEFVIPFGININDRVITWLGDLDLLDDVTLTFLKIHNIDSDHMLINSEFYLAQMCCIFSEPIIEQQIVNKRNKLYDLLKIKFLLNINHLDEEVIGVLGDLKKPITYSEIEIRPVISALHKIIIEAVNTENLKAFYRQKAQQVDQKHNSWGSIKLYEFMLMLISNKHSIDDEIKDLISPLYILNDLRILYFHMLSQEKQNELKQNIVNTLQIASFDDSTEMYNKLLARLNTLFEYMVKVL